MKKTKTKKTYFYRDALNDDFAKLQIKPIEINENFKYQHNKIYWFFAFAIRIIFIPILYCVSKIIYATSVKNKKVLKKIKNKGYFIYSNHTSAFDPINHACLVNPTKYSAIIASLDSFSIKGLGGFVHLIGAIPVPQNLKMYKNFFGILKYHIQKKRKVVVYPEAHIWPYYYDIRPFKSVSFRYPCELDTPILVATTIYKKRKILHTPKMVIILNEPLYPNKDLPLKQQIQDLRDRTYDLMKLNVSHYGTYRYYSYENLNKIN